MKELNPTNPEAERLRKIKEEAATIGGSLPQLTDSPFRQKEGEQTTAAQELQERLKQIALQASLAQTLRKPVPEQARFSDWLVKTEPFQYGKNEAGEKTLKGGEAPAQQVEEITGWGKNLTLSKLTPHEAKYLDIKYKMEEIAAQWCKPRREITPEYIRERENMEVMAYAITRRAVEGFTMNSLIKTVQEAITTFHTEGEASYQKRKGKLTNILGGK
jgi:hypothetical protein